MALCMTRDSVLDLVELHAEQEAKEEMHAETDDPALFLDQKEGESTVVSICLDVRSNEDENKEDDSVAEPSKTPDLGTHMLLSELQREEWVHESSGTNDSGLVADDDVYEDYYEFDPTALHSSPKRNIFACFFPYLQPKEDAEAQQEPVQASSTANKPVQEALKPAVDLEETPKPEVASDPLSQPEGATNSLEQDADMVSESKTQTASLRSILKKKSTSRSSREVLADTTANDDNRNRNRRALFPVYEAPKAPKKEDGRHIQFWPLARQVAIESKKNWSPIEKADIWWQPSDYADFKKTARMVARAMLQSGSEVWLMTNPSWKQGGVAPKKERYEDNKWWHRFGHSRRGLEHVASPDEGKQRQENVKKGVYAVLEEKRRNSDPERIRSVYVRYNTWARELAFAAGASDAEAVKSNFCDDRRSREFYVLQHRGKGCSGHVPDFMKPSDVSLQTLDTYTVSQIRSRRNQQVKLPQESSKQDASQDILMSRLKASIAKKAAGFGTGDGQVSMSAVLTGMGAVAGSKQPAASTIGLTTGVRDRVD